MVRYSLRFLPQSWGSDEYRVVCIDGDRGLMLWKIDRVHVSNARGILTRSSVVREAFRMRTSDGSFHVDMESSISSVMDPNSVLSMLNDHDGDHQYVRRPIRSEASRKGDDLRSGDPSSQMKADGSAAILSESALNDWITKFRRRVVRLQLKKVGGVKHEHIERDLHEAKVAYWNFLGDVGLDLNSGLAPRWTLQKEDDLTSCSVAKLLSEIRSALRIHIKDANLLMRTSVTKNSAIDRSGNDADNNNLGAPSSKRTTKVRNVANALEKHIDMTSLLVSDSRGRMPEHSTSSKVKSEKRERSSNSGSSKRHVPVDKNAYDKDLLRSAVESWRDVPSSHHDDATAARSDRTDRNALEINRPRREESPTRLRYAMMGGAEKTENGENGCRDNVRREETSSGNYSAAAEYRKKISPILDERRRRRQPRPLPSENFDPRQRRREETADLLLSPPRQSRRPGTATSPGVLFPPPKLNMEDLSADLGDEAVGREDVEYPENMFSRDESHRRRRGEVNVVDREAENDGQHQSFAAHLRKELSILDEFERNAIGDMVRRKVRLGEIVEELAIAKEQLKSPLSDSTHVAVADVELPSEPENTRRAVGGGDRRAGGTVLRPLPRQCVSDAFQSLPHARSRTSSSATATESIDDGDGRISTRVGDRGDSNVVPRQKARSSKDNWGDDRRYEKSRSSSKNRQDDLGCDSSNQRELFDALHKNIDLIEADFHILNTQRVHFEDFEETINAHVALTPEGLRELFYAANVAEDGTVDPWAFVKLLRESSESVGLIRVDKASSSSNRRSRREKVGSGASQIPRPKIKYNRGAKTLGRASATLHSRETLRVSSRRATKADRTTGVDTDDETTGSLEYRAAFGEVTAGQELARRRVEEYKRKQCRRDLGSKSPKIRPKRRTKSASTSRLTPHSRAKQRALRVLREKRKIAEDKERNESLRKERLRLLEFSSKRAREAAVSSTSVLKDGGGGGAKNIVRDRRGRKDLSRRDESYAANDDQYHRHQSDDDDDALRHPRDTPEAQRRARVRASDRARELKARQRIEREKALAKWKSRFDARDRRLEAFKRRQERDEEDVRSLSNDESRDIPSTPPNSATRPGITRDGSVYIKSGTVDVASTAHVRLRAHTATTTRNDDYDTRAAVPSHMSTPIPRSAARFLEHRRAGVAAVAATQNDNVRDVSDFDRNGRQRLGFSSNDAPRTSIPSAESPPRKLSYILSGGSSPPKPSNIHPSEIRGAQRPRVHVGRRGSVDIDFNNVATAAGTEGDGPASWKPRMSLREKRRFVSTYGK